MKDRLLFDVVDKKKVRVIIDTDAACEADDPYAIVQALLSPRFIVKAIVAEHFAQPDSTKRSFDEVRRILEAMDMTDVPCLMGEDGPFPEGSLSGPAGDSTAATARPAVSEGVRLIIDEALKDDPHPLFVLCQGAITNVAAAFRACPETVSRMTVIWIGTHGFMTEVPWREFNAGNDVQAANFVLSSGADIWLVPSTVYSTVTVGLAELQKKVLPCGKIGRHLFENMRDYNMTPQADWTKGESWALGDNPAPALALNPDCGHWVMHEAPFVEADTSSSFGHGLPQIRIYKDIDSRYVLEDMFAKLELCYGD